MSLQIILQATVLTANATVAVDDISITKECGVVNKPLPGASQKSEGKFYGFQYIFPNACYVWLWLGWQLQGTPVKM